MNKFLQLASVFAFAMSAQAFGQSMAPGDAVSVDPDVHNVVLENEYVRVFDARASKGTKSPMHSHPPFVLISVGKARLRMATPDGKTSIFDLNPGQVFWLEGVRHSWELLAGELHAIGVEIKSAQKEGPPPAAPQRKANDSATADPEAHHVLFENPHVRVFEGRTSGGRKSPMHSHPPSLFVSLDWMRLKLTLPDGKTVIHDFSPNQVLWFGDGAEHSWEALAGSGRVIAIEVKSAAAAATK
jgi:quercetin dioxygenase-like cupin family protein